MTKGVTGDQWTSRDHAKSQRIFIIFKHTHVLFEQNATLYAIQSYSESERGW